MASVPQPSIGAARQDLYRRMDKHHLAPLWEVLHNLIPNEPATPCKPALWKYRDARPHLMEAGKLITAKEAIRRVLILENPGMRGESCITQSLYAGLQLILPGEIAPSHRHSQSALRFIVEGSGAYTAVDGERTTMHPGDFIITPSWTWHDHGNPGNDPVVWMDGLDIRIVQMFAAQFHEVFPEEVQPVAREEGASVARYGNNLVPLGAAAPFGRTSPIFNYPYARSRESLAKLSRDQDPDACHGWKMQFINPLTGGHAMPTIAAFIQLLPKGFRSAPTRSTDGSIYSVVEGEGTAVIGNEKFQFEPRDTFVVPSWMPLTLEATSESVLFSFSDRPGQEAMGLWREKRG
jgi:gentisate 1,2-dioxygenase